MADEVCIVRFFIGDLSTRAGMIRRVVASLRCEMGGDHEQDLGREGGETTAL